MLDYANNHKEELRKLFINAWRNEKYKYLICNPYSFSSILMHTDGLDNTRNKHHFISIYQDQVLGYITYNISRSDNRVYGLEIINFTSNSVVFGVDLKRILTHIFELYKFRKLNFLVVIGNPIEKMYDKLIKKYNGRIVGTRHKHIKLIDNKYYDVKEYEIFREDYLKARGDINAKNINS